MAPAPLFDLAPDGVYPAAAVTSDAVRSYRTISPLPAPKGLGGVLSVALSVESLRPGVTWRPALWSPDFPLPQGSDHPADFRLQGSACQPPLQELLTWIRPGDVHL